MEKDRLADWTFSEIKEKVLKNEIPWEKLPAYESKRGDFSLPPAMIQIPGSPSKEIERSFTLGCKWKERQGIKGEIYRLLQVDIKLTLNRSSKNYEYPLLVRQIPDERAAQRSPGSSKPGEASD